MNSPAFVRASMVLCLLLAGVMHAQVKDEGAAKSKILTLENIWNQAEKAGDLKALDVLFDPDLAFVDTDGSLLTKAELLARMRSEHLQSLVTETTSIQVFGDTAVVIGIFQGKDLRNGKLLSFEGRFTDTWIYRSSSWVCIAAQATPILQRKNN